MKFPVSFTSDSGSSLRELNDFPTISSSTGLSRDFGNNSEVDELKDSSEEDPLILNTMAEKVHACDIMRDSLLLWSLLCYAGSILSCYGKNINQYKII